MSARDGKVADMTEINQVAEESTPPPWTQAPAGWPVLSENLTEHARQVVLSALAVDGMHAAHERLAEDAEMNAPDLLSGPPDDVTTADLLAVALQVAVPPVAARRLLAHGGHRLEVLAALTDLPDDDLVLAGPSALVGMEHLLAVIGDVMSAGHVPKSFDGFIGGELLCARKRPGLFPTLTGPVRGALGLRGEQHRRRDWLLLRALLGDREVMSAIDDLSDRVRAESHQLAESVGPERLQILCAALNTEFVSDLISAGPALTRPAMIAGSSNLERITVMAAKDETERLQRMIDDLRRMREHCEPKSNQNPVYLRFSGAVSALKWIIENSDT